MSNVVPSAPVRPLWQRLLLRRLKFLLVVAVILVIGLGSCYLFAPQWLMRANFMRQAASAHVEARTLKAGDTTWAYYEGGDGPQIVLLHGYGASKESFLPLAEKLTPHFHVIIPDLPGWGDSSRIEGGNYNIDAQAARLQDFVQTKGLHGFILAGHSMGGAIAGVYAAEHPEHAAGLVLIDALGLKFKENAFSREALAGKNPFIYDSRDDFQKVLQLVFDKPPQIPGRFVDVLIKRNQHDRSFLQRTFQQLSDPAQALAVQHRLSQYTMPVLGLWCIDDKVIDISALESLRNGLSHARSINATTLIGCNHMPILEKPDETARVLSSFTLAQ